MKKLLALLTIAFAGTAFAGGEMKEVCTDKKDSKKIKVHKKVEGEKVPDGKK
jgi:hypothetical protein